MLSMFKPLFDVSRKSNLKEMSQFFQHINHNQGFVFQDWGERAYKSFRLQQVDNLHTDACYLLIFSPNSFKTFSALAPSSLFGGFPCHSYFRSNSGTPRPGMVFAMMTEGLSNSAFASPTARWMSAKSCPFTSITCQLNACHLSESVSKGIISSVKPSI